MFNAHATTFTVEPTQITLSGRTASVLLTLRNESTEALRFELSAFTWAQSPSGEMQLAATEDVVFFPSLLTVGPGESRRVRVGSATSSAAHEKSYRIFVEELPPANRQGNGVRVLTKMGIPIFVAPSKEVAAASLSTLDLQNGALRFTLINDGTVHFLPRDVRIKGFAGSAVALEDQASGWSVLAGGRREFNVPLKAAQCSGITSLLVEIEFGSDLLQERLQTPNGVCSR